MFSLPLPFTRRYWWYWPLCVSTPALVLGIFAVLAAFLAADLRSAAVSCGIIGIILSLGVITWCSVDLALCYSYQGPEVPDLFDKLSKKLSPSSDPDHWPNTPLEKAYYYHTNGYFCAGACYDWNFRKKYLSKIYECQQTIEKWMVEKQLGKTVKYCMYQYNYQPGSNTPGVSHLGSYLDSPIYQTHAYITQRKGFYYSEGEERSLRDDREKFCRNFDVSKFTEERQKCDEKLEESFRPRCEMSLMKEQPSRPKWKVGYNFQGDLTEEIKEKRHF